VLAGIEQGWFQRAIAESAFREQQRYESGDLVKVGVNAFVADREPEVEILEIGPEVERRQVAALTRMRARREPTAVAAALSALRDVAEGEGDLIEPIVACARARCTEGEIVAALGEVFGSYRETPRF
jgi:methylmalonyl-CoA mutase N-terminal domain/subunit